MQPKKNYCFPCVKQLKKIVKSYATKLNKKLLAMHCTCFACAVTSGRKRKVIRHGLSGKNMWSCHRPVKQLLRILNNCKH